MFCCCGVAVVLLNHIFSVVLLCCVAVLPPQLAVAVDHFVLTHINFTIFIVAASTVDDILSTFHSVWLLCVRVSQWTISATAISTPSQTSTGISNSIQAFRIQSKDLDNLINCRHLIMFNIDDVVTFLHSLFKHCVCCCCCCCCCNYLQLLMLILLPLELLLLST